MRSKNADMFATAMTRRRVNADVVRQERKTKKGKSVTLVRQGSQSGTRGAIRTGKTGSKAAVTSIRDTTACAHRLRSSPTWRRKAGFGKTNQTCLVGHMSTGCYLGNEVSEQRRCECCAKQKRHSNSAECTRLRMETDRRQSQGNSWNAVFDWPDS